MVVTATWRTTIVLNLFLIRDRVREEPQKLRFRCFTELTPLQVGNRPRAPPAQTGHPFHALVLLVSCGYHLMTGVNARLTATFTQLLTCDSVSGTFVHSYSCARDAQAPATRSGGSAPSKGGSAPFPCVCPRRAAHHLQMAQQRPSATDLVADWYTGCRCHPSSRRCHAALVWLELRELAHTQYGPIIINIIMHVIVVRAVFLANLRHRLQTGGRGTRRRQRVTGDGLTDTELGG